MTVTELTPLVSPDDKVERPHAHVAHPTDIVVDPSLGKDEKLKMLDALEQDAHQLSAASAEGMTGGEPTQLHDVLMAKEALALPPREIALSVTLQSLKSKLPSVMGTDAHALIQSAIIALEAACAVMKDKPSATP
ncbi:MAG: hypothetical protein ACOVKO_00665 [Elstera sp.]